MSDFYQVPEAKGPSAADLFAVRVKEAGMAATKLIETWKAAYEKFWQTPRTHGDRALTKEQVQAFINEDKALVGDILTDSAAFIAFLQSSHPDRIGTELFPERYLTSPYPIDETLTIGDLKPEWEVQENNE